VRGVVREVGAIGGEATGCGKRLRERRWGGGEVRKRWWARVEMLEGGGGRKGGGGVEGVMRVGGTERQRRGGKGVRGRG